MKKYISIIVAIMAILQCTVLLLFFTNKLPNFPQNLTSIVWAGSDLLGIIFGGLFFVFNKDTKIPTGTIFTLALLGLVGFPLLLFKHWIIVVLLIILGFAVYFYSHKDSKFAIFPVISSVVGTYSLGLYLLMRFIISM